MTTTPSGIYRGRTVWHSLWWDDAVTHAHWLAARTGLRYRVRRGPSLNGQRMWSVGVATVRQR